MKLETAQDAIAAEHAAAVWWMQWAWRLEAFVDSHPVQCRCWDLDRKPFRNATLDHTDDCAEWRELVGAIRTKPKMQPGPIKEDVAQQGAEGQPAEGRAP